MKYIYIATFVILVSFVGSFSQSLSPYVISTAGGYVEDNSNNLSLSFTIGEPIVETAYSIKNILTQGFQQPFESTTSSIESQNQDFTITISIYPNPFYDELNLEFSADKPDDFDIEIIDLLGQNCVNKSSFNYVLSGSNKHQINTGHLSMGVYLLKIYSNTSGEVYSYKLNRVLPK